MKKLSVTLSQDIIDFLEKLVNSGKYADKEDAIRRLLDDLKDAAKDKKPAGGGGDTGDVVVIQMRLPDVF